MILFAVNLAFIVTHVYGWLLKWFYKPEAYREHFGELFPAQRAVGVIYLLQLFEIPYLLQIGDRDALLYVNAFSLLFFSIQMLVMCDGYFFPAERRTRRQNICLYVPAAVVLLPMLLQAVNLVALPEGWRTWTVGAVSILFLAYFLQSVRMALLIRHAVQQANEEHYADSDDFSVRFANIIRWVPTLILFLLAINFYADDPWVKCCRDVLFIGANVWFCILTLNPWRNVPASEPVEQVETAEKGYRFDEQAVRLGAAHLRRANIHRAAYHQRPVDVAAGHQQQIPGRGHTPLRLRLVLRHDLAAKCALCHQPHPPVPRPPDGRHLGAERLFVAGFDGESIQIAGQENPLELPQLRAGRAGDENYFR